MPKIPLSENTNLVSFACDTLSPSPFFSRTGDTLSPCVGRLEIAEPKPVGSEFLCGTIPIPTYSAFPLSDSALFPSPSHTSYRKTNSIGHGASSVSSGTMHIIATSRQN